MLPGLTFLGLFRATETCVPLKVGVAICGYAHWLKELSWSELCSPTMDNRTYHSGRPGYSSAESADDTSYSTSHDPYVFQPASNQWLTIGAANNATEGGVHVRDGSARSTAVEDRSDQIFDLHRAPTNSGRALIPS